jgi:steroid 5-alpha reductase family enzyme
MNVSGFLLLLVAVTASLGAIMSVAWLVWSRTRNSGWIDTFWTFGVGLTGCSGALTANLVSHTERSLLVMGLAAVWSLRLGIHIARRTAQIDDDPRYAALIRQWGSAAPRQMFSLAQKQVIVSVPLAASIIIAAFNPVPELRASDWSAVAILVAAIVGEAIADHQLWSFRRNPANRTRVCTTGLWSWSRHPNYFFEWLGWCAYPLIAFDLSGAYPWGVFALAAPLCMYWLLVYVSGIPPLEAHMLERRPEEFRAYQARTSSFFPLPPRHPREAL